MRIDAVSFVHPETAMSNSQVCEEVRAHSKDTFKGDLDKTLVSIEFLLGKIGAKNRFWMKNERPIDLIVRATENAIAKAGIEKGDIDFLISAGVTRGFLEPSDAYFVAHALGMEKVECFDILDACMAWTRACDVMDAFFKSGKYKRGLIVNCESYYDFGGVSYPSNFQLKSVRDIAHCFSAYCGGDGATATIVSPGPETPWEFHYATTKQFANLCTVPLPGWEKRTNVHDKICLNGPGSFTSFSSQFFQSMDSYFVDVLKRLERHFPELAVIFCHTGGDLDQVARWADRAGVGHLVKCVFADYGNLGAASMPASLALATEKGDVKRGDRIAFWTGSSGMTFGTTCFQY